MGWFTRLWGRSSFFGRSGIVIALLWFSGVVIAASAWVYETFIEDVDIAFGESFVVSLHEDVGTKADMRLTVVGAEVLEARLGTIAGISEDARTTGVLSIEVLVENLESRSVDNPFFGIKACLEGTRTELDRINTLDENGDIASRFPDRIDAGQLLSLESTYELPVGSSDVYLLIDDEKRVALGAVTNPYGTAIPFLRTPRHCR